MKFDEIVVVSLYINYVEKNNVLSSHNQLDVVNDNPNFQLTFFFFKYFLYVNSLCYY